MSMAVILVKGTTTQGIIKHEADGTTTQIPAQFTPYENGGTIAVGLYNLETQVLEGQLEVYGDFAPAAYLGRAYEFLAPVRRSDMPDLRSIFAKIGSDTGNACPLFEFCNHICSDCTIREWMEEGTKT